MNVLYAVLCTVIMHNKKQLVCPMPTWGIKIMLKINHIYFYLITTVTKDIYFKNSMRMQAVGQPWIPRLSTRILWIQFICLAMNGLKSRHGGSFPPAWKVICCPMCRSSSISNCCLQLRVKYNIDRQTDGVSPVVMALNTVADLQSFQFAIRSASHPLPMVMSFVFWRKE